MSQAVDLRHLDYAKRGEFYIAGSDWNLAWTKDELETVRELREKGAKVWEVAEAVDRPDYEVAVLIMSLEERGKE
jgi:Pyruvate/2-oxoacid:ferredoxin oxidoreductase gamma subunit